MRLQAKFINFNPHTTVTVGDLRTQLGDFNGILTYKRPLLEKEIEFKKSRGVTPAQIKVGCILIVSQTSNLISDNIIYRRLRTFLFSLTAINPGMSSARSSKHASSRLGRS